MTKLDLTALFVARYGHSPEEGYYLIKYSSNSIKRAIYFRESFPPRIGGWTCVRYSKGIGQKDAEVNAWRRCEDAEITHKGNGLRQLISSLNLPVIQMTTSMFKNVTGQDPKEGYCYRVTKRIIGKPLISDPYKYKNIHHASADGPDTVFLYEKGNWILVA